MKVVLATPPISDPTAPYHSTVYLASHLRAAGFDDVAVQDLNIEWLNYEARSDVREKRLLGLQDRRRDLDARSNLSCLESHELLRLLGLNLDPDRSELDQALDTFRNPDRFFQPDDYLRAVRTTNSWLGELGASCFPLRLDGFDERHLDGFNKKTVNDLGDRTALAERTQPFLEYCRSEVLPRWRTDEVDVVGLSATYDRNIAFTLALGRLVQEELPQAKVILGGVAISKWWKYLLDKQHAQVLFKYVDYVVVGEGETALLRLLEALDSNREPEGLSNVLSFDPHRQVVRDLPGLHFEDINALVSPDFQGVEWAQYFSPYPYALYSPTRGCYWNRCTFCDYGLNSGGPTSPWRERKLDLVMEDLQTIREQAKHIYFSVDVLAPKGLRRLAERVAETGLDIRWSAEIRPEKSYGDAFCKTLKASGCTAVSVGFESGSQRILDLIDKGTRVESIRETIHNFRNAEIPVQMMSFFDFPTETARDAERTVDFLDETKADWDLFGWSSFSLTAGSYVAKRPKDFRLKVLRPEEGVESNETPHYEPIEPSKTPEEIAAFRQRFQEKLLREARLTGEFRRPFAGGIDTAHTIFFYDHFGPDCFKNLRKAMGQRTAKGSEFTLDTTPRLLMQRLHTTDLAIAEVAQLFDEANGLIRDKKEKGQAVNRQVVAEVFATLPPVTRLDSPQVHYLIPHSFRVFTPSEGAQALLQLVDGFTAVREIIQRSNQEPAMILNFLRELHGRGLIEALSPAVENTSARQVG